MITAHVFECIKCGEIDGPAKGKEALEFAKQGCPGCGRPLKLTGHKDDTIVAFKLVCPCGHTRTAKYHDPARLNYYLTTPCEDCGGRFTVLERLDKVAATKQYDRPRYKALYEQAVLEVERLRPRDLDGRDGASEAGGVSEVAGRGLDAPADSK